MHAILLPFSPPHTMASTPAAAASVSSIPPLALTARPATDGRTRAARQEEWLPVVSGSEDYDAVASAAHVLELGRSKSSTRVHAKMRSDYIRFSARVKVDPMFVTLTTAAHVANFYFARTKKFKLGMSTSKHISAQMTIFFNDLGHTGTWATGKDAQKVPFFSGNPNNSDVVAKSKTAHKAALAAAGKITLPVDPLEYGRMVEYYDHFFLDQEDVHPFRLCQHAAMLTSTFLLMRFDEASKIKYFFCCAFVPSRAHFFTILETLAFITRDGTNAVAMVLV